MSLLQKSYPEYVPDLLQKIDEPQIVIWRRSNRAPIVFRFEREEFHWTRLTNWPYSSEPFVAVSPDYRIAVVLSPREMGWNEMHELFDLVTDGVQGEEVEKHDAVMLNREIPTDILPLKRIRRAIRVFGLTDLPEFRFAFCRFIKPATSCKKCGAYVWYGIPHYECGFATLVEGALRYIAAQGYPTDGVVFRNLMPHPLNISAMSEVFDRLGQAQPWELLVDCGVARDLDEAMSSLHALVSYDFERFRAFTIAAIHAVMEFRQSRTDSLKELFDRLHICRRDAIYTAFEAYWDERNDQRGCLGREVEYVIDRVLKTHKFSPSDVVHYMVAVGTELQKGRH